MKNFKFLLLGFFVLVSVFVFASGVGGDTLVSCIEGVSQVDVMENVSNHTEIVPHQGLTFWGLIRSIIGVIVLLSILYAFSLNRKKISWKLVVFGLGLQVIIAICIQKVPFVSYIFEFISRIFVKVLDFSGAGAEFLFGNLLNVSSFGYIFAFQVLPTIIFFSALTSVLFYLGIIQKVVGVMAVFMTKLLGISGAESLSVAGNIFLGQTESPLMIKPYLSRMNNSEIFLVMVGGMATLAGGVLAAYISFLGGTDPVLRQQFAKTLLMASVMAAPGAIVAAKILVPQTEKVDTDVKVSMDKIGTNFLDALTNGASEGLKLAVNVAAMLLVFVAFIFMINYIFIKIGDWTHLDDLLSTLTGGVISNISLQNILGTIFYPLLVSLGVPLNDCVALGGLLGQKIIASEFVAYTDLHSLMANGALFNQKSIIMAAVMLSGFANFASIGIQIGGIGSLAPNKRELLSKFGLRALLAGTFASLLSATIVGGILG